MRFLIQRRDLIAIAALTGFTLLPQFALAQSLSHSMSCEIVSPTAFAEQHKLRKDMQLMAICKKHTLALHSTADDAAIQENEPLERKTTIVTSVVVAVLPTRVWRLNHWYDWVKWIGKEGSA